MLVVGVGDKLLRVVVVEGREGSGEILEVLLVLVPVVVEGNNDSDSEVSLESTESGAAGKLGNDVVISGEITGSGAFISLP